MRDPVDLDIVGRYQDISNFCNELGKVRSFIPIEHGKKIVANIHQADGNNLIVEAEIAWKDTTARELLEIVKRDSQTLVRNGLLIPSIDILYLLKMSHRYLKNSPFFMKTMNDIHALRALGAKINPEHREFFKQRKAETYTYSHPKLDVNKVDFFKGDGINYVYDHDSIHEAVKCLEAPAYTFFKEKDAEVFCSKELFFATEERIRYNAVLEEAYVLALERSQIPFRNKVTAEQSFNMALTKICTSITSGWFREFAWENWYKIQEMRDLSYADKFFAQADAGLVKLYGG